MTTETRRYTEEQMDAIVLWAAAQQTYDMELLHGNSDRLFAAERMIQRACSRVVSLFYPVEVCDVAA
jgi:hypothetical protein